MRKVFDWKRRTRRLGADQSGQVMVESAIVLPIFLYMICGIIEMSILWSIKSVVDYAAYAAARAGSVHNGDTEPMKWAASQALAPVTFSHMPIDLRAGAGAGSGEKFARHFVAAAVAHAQFDAWYCRIFEYLPDAAGNNELVIYLFQAGAINRMRVLDPTQADLADFDPSAVDGAEDDLLREPKPEEIGETVNLQNFRKRGLRYNSSTASVRDNLRLRVEVIHGHKLFFQFLRPGINLMPPSMTGYWQTDMVRLQHYQDDVQEFGNMDQDHRFLRQSGRVLIRSEYTIRMYTNFFKY